MRKTHTSWEVKERYNRRHYEQVIVRTAQGGRAAIQELAAMHGLSVSAYIRHLVIADAIAHGKPDISGIIGGGGRGAEYFSAARNSTGEVMRELHGWAHGIL